MTEERKYFKDYIFKSEFLKKIAICLFSGFSSGLPFAFIVSLLPIWLSQKGIDIRTIGLFILIQLPYSFKFLWSAFIDNYFISYFGRRRTWMLFSQILLLIFICSYAFLDKEIINMNMVFLLGFLVVLSSATQDIALDSYRREILSDEELGVGNSIYINSYRLATLIPGSLSLILIPYFSWGIIFIINGLFIILGIFLTLIISEPVNNLESLNYFKSMIISFKEFFNRKGVKSGLLILLFILLYRLGDSMALSLISPFYLKMGYSVVDIGLIVKNCSLWVSIVFGILGGVIILKIGINRALFFFGLVQIIAILGFAWLASFKFFEVITIKEKLILSLVVSLEYIGVGLCTAVYVSFIYKQTNPLYSATQISLLISLSSVPRTIISSISGYLINLLGGYYNFFLICVLLSIPGIILSLKIAPLNEKNS